MITCIRRMAGEGFLLDEGQTSRLISDYYEAHKEFNPARPSLVSWYSNYRAVCTGTYRAEAYLWEDSEPIGHVVMVPSTSVHYGPVGTVLGFHLRTDKRTKANLRGMHKALRQCAELLGLPAYIQIRFKSPSTQVHIYRSL